MSSSVRTLYSKWWREGRADTGRSPATLSKLLCSVAPGLQLNTIPKQAPKLMPDQCGFVSLLIFGFYFIFLSF